MTALRQNDKRSGCVVCGSPLEYSPSTTEKECHYCREVSSTTAACANGHFVCDTCHSASANDLIQRVCSATNEKEPLALAMTLMRDERLKMHGPEHHFLVPAVLLAVYANASSRPPGTRAHWVATARSRAQQIPGGVCGFNGACGAGIGTGIFVSVATAATPLSGPEWRLGNLMSAESLRSIALHGGPRCCKRDTFLALMQAVGFVKEHFGQEIPSASSPRCEWSTLNRECLGQECPFFGES